MSRLSSEEFEKKRDDMIKRYVRLGYLKNPSMIEAMRKVPREIFMPDNYRQYAYLDEAFPIPGDGRQTISAPYTYPLFYEPLELVDGDKFLEIGMGSGYGAALAKEIVGEKGLVVTMEINTDTFKFGIQNLQRGSYLDILTILSDGSIGYPKLAPYDKISVTAACPNVPRPLIDQLNKPGRLIAPVGPLSNILGQDLILLEKDAQGEEKIKKISKVIYVPLQGEYGWDKKGLE